MTRVQPVEIKYKIIYLKCPSFGYINSHCPPITNAHVQYPLQPVFQQSKLTSDVYLLQFVQMYCESGAVFEVILRLHLVKTLVDEDYKKSDTKITFDSVHTPTHIHYILQVKRVSCFAAGNTAVLYFSVFQTLRINWTLYTTILFIFGATVPTVGQSLLIHELSRSHTMTHHNR